MKIKGRKSLFLSTTILRGRLCKDTADGGGDIEVGPGFAAAVGDDPNDVSVDNRDDDQGDDDNQGGGSGDDDQGDDDNGEPSKPQKRGKSFEERARESAARIRRAETENRELKARLAQLENAGLTKTQQTDNTGAQIGEKPNPQDSAKYPLGVLDDRYIEDMIEWTAEKKTAEKLDSVLRRDQERQKAARVEQHMAQLREKVDEVTAKGAELFDDFEESVLEAGLRGDYPLTETTFTAASESPFGAQILYDLANDRKEAARVAGLTPYQQIKFVHDRETELAEKSKGRTKPQAGQPPQNSPRGRNGSNPIRPDTDNLDDFRKIFYAKK